VVCGCSTDLYACSDFTTHERAQACFDFCLDTMGFDVHRLDGDDDGVVCESLP
jgi:hypothetical protein